jgi:hypothetical protein
MSSAMRPSASSGVCLNLKVSVAAAWGGPLPLVAEAGTGFLGAEAAGADVEAPGVGSFEAAAPGGFFV